MKKVFIISLVLLGIATVNTRSNQVLIPKQAIRFRVIANSNQKSDQDIKLLVRNKIQTELYNDVVNTKNIKEARNIVKHNLNKYDATVKIALTENQINQDYTINYGTNYFPEKTYKGVVYPEGNYESLVVTLGNGIGENWWCVLFPPLCLLEAEETEEKTTVEYHSFIKDILDKYF